MITVGGVAPTRLASHAALIVLFGILLLVPSPADGDATGTALSPGDVVVGVNGETVGFAVFDSSGEHLVNHACSECSRVRDVEIVDGAVIHGLVDRAGQGAVVSLPPTNGLVRSIASGGRLDSGRGLTTTPNGRLVVSVDDETSGAGILTVDPLGGEVEVLAETLDLDEVGGIASADGNLIIVGSRFDAGEAIPLVIRLTSEGNPEVIATGDASIRTQLNRPVDVAAESGRIFVLDVRSRGAAAQDEVRIFEIASDGGTQLLTVGIEGVVNVEGAQPFLGIDVTHGLIYVIDYAVGGTAGGINVFDPATGLFQSITIESIVEEPSGLAVVPGALAEDLPFPDAGTGTSPVTTIVVLSLGVLALVAFGISARRRAAQLGS